MNKLKVLRNVVLTVGLSLLIYGCGKENNSNSSNNAAPVAQPVVTCQGSCPVGQIQTQYGCQVQTPACGECGALVGGQCISGNIYNPNNPAYPNSACQGSCGVGQIQTYQFGCQPLAAQCGPCGALINNQCVYGNQMGSGGMSGGYYNYQYYTPYRSRQWGPFHVWYY